MKNCFGWLLVCFMSLAGIVRAADPAVTNVQAAQRPGTGLVDITYDLADADTDTLFVSLSVSTNGGATFFSPAADVSGAVGNVARGNGKAILWNAKSELPEKLFTNMRAMVTADDNWVPPPPTDMVRIPGGTNSGTNPLGTGESYDYWYPETYLLTVETFYMDAAEVTKAKWDEVYVWAITHGYSFEHAGAGKAENQPVQTINWYDCVKWCNARSQKEGRTPCYSLSDWSCNFSANGYRLPTKTEWEYAARGGLSGKRFPWGDRIDHTRANYRSWWIEGAPSSSYDDGYEGYDVRYWTGGYPMGDYPYTSPAGAFAANGYGLYDMAGNVWEWCNDVSGSLRAFRGGSWYGSDGATSVRCSGNFNGSPLYAYNYIGFRTVCR